MSLYASCLFLACLLWKPSLSLPFAADYNLVPARSLRDQDSIPYPSNEMLRDAIKRVPELDQIMYNTMHAPNANQRQQQQQQQFDSIPPVNKGVLPKFILEGSRIHRRRSLPTSSGSGSNNNNNNAALAHWLSKLTSNQTFRHKKDGSDLNPAWPMALDEFVDKAKGRQWYVENGVDTRFPLPERRKFPEVDWRGFNEDVFHEGFGDFTPMKRQNLRWR